MSELLEDYRCTCGKLLFRGLLLVGSIEVKCRECKRIAVASGLKPASSKHRFTFVLDAAGKIVKTADPKAATGYDADELQRLAITDVIVLLQDDFYTSLWESLDADGHAAALIPTLQKNKDRSTHPVRLEARGAAIGGEKVLVCTLTRSSGEHARFAPGGVLASTDMHHTAA